MNTLYRGGHGGGLYAALWGAMGNHLFLGSSILGGACNRQFSWLVGNPRATLVWGGKYTLERLSLEYWC